MILRSSNLHNSISYTGKKHDIFILNQDHASYSEGIYQSTILIHDLCLLVPVNLHEMANLKN